MFIGVIYLIFKMILLAASLALIISGDLNNFDHCIKLLRADFMFRILYAIEIVLYLFTFRKYYLRCYYVKLLIFHLLVISMLLIMNLAELYKGRSKLHVAGYFQQSADVPNVNPAYRAIILSLYITLSGTSMLCKGREIIRTFRRVQGYYSCCGSSKL